MVTVVRVGKDNWNNIARKVLRSEKHFKKAIRTSRKDYLEIVSDGDAVINVAFLSQNYVGNAIGYPPTEPEMEEYDLAHEFGKTKYLYLFNIIIEPKFQGKGIGKELMKGFLKSAKDQGFDKVIGHFRPNGSLALLKKFGGEEVRVCRNWENTGEHYSFCELNLKNLQFSEDKITVKN